MELLKHLSQRQYIDGEWVESTNKNTRDIINPYNQEVIFTVSEGTKEDAERAILAARRAFESGEWSQETAEKRGKKVRAIADKIKEHREALARLETLDTGKTLEESYADMDDIHNVFMYFAGLADKDGGEMIDSPIPDTESKIVKEPVGVVTQITPWNYPLLQASWKIAPALATGCSLVMKPSEITPLTTIRVFELDGLFFEPTVITNCDTSMRIVQEEVFGPVVTVEGFETEQEAIQLANDSIYGLAGAVFSKDIGKAQRVANKLKLGTVWINDFHPYFAQAPWGGYKQSGIGRELGKEGLEEYLVSKHILTNTNPQLVNWFSK